MRISKEMIILHIDSIHQLFEFINIEKYRYIQNMELKKYKNISLESEIIPNPLIHFHSVTYFLMSITPIFQNCHILTQHRNHDIQNFKSRYVHLNACFNTYIRLITVLHMINLSSIYKLEYQPFCHHLRRLRHRVLLLTSEKHVEKVIEYIYSTF